MYMSKRVGKGKGPEVSVPVGDAARYALGVLEIVRVRQCSIDVSITSDLIYCFSLSAIARKLHMTMLKKTLLSLLWTRVGWCTS